jgi:2-polyprenyl-6-methoxyphenol hydroxylase-like FAD-dependent oxidoreductase
MANTLETTCCVVGGGPAGVMLGLLLARNGVQVTVLEKHKDFFRDFRGDTVHPSTLDLMWELGFLEDFLRVPHQEITSAAVVIGPRSFRIADFRHLPTRCKFIALMPQWDFLNFLSEQGRRYQELDLRMEHEAVDLLRDDYRVSGVKVRTPQGEIEVRADLVVGCDGRSSTIRQASGLEVMEFGVPIDVLWFRISRRPNDPNEVLGNVNYGKALVLINRGDYFQAGLLIRKGALDEIKAQGLESLQQSLLRIAPYLGKRVEEITDWEQVKLLTVKLNRLKQWYAPGMLCIGDAAHAMSPAGGVGINLAVQDAVATSNILADALRERRVTVQDLAAVQQRREFPTRVIQTLQKTLHKGFERVFENPGPAAPPRLLELAEQIPGIQRIPARIIGLGVRREHIRGAESPGCPARTLVKTAVGLGLLAATAALGLAAMRKLSATR